MRWSWEQNTKLYIDLKLVGVLTLIKRIPLLIREKEEEVDRWLEEYESMTWYQTEIEWANFMTWYQCQNGWV